MGNKQSNQSHLTLISGVKQELLFYGYIRRIDKLFKKNNKHIPQSIIEICFEFHSKYLYLTKFERIADQFIFNREAINSLIDFLSLLLRENASNIMNGEELKKWIFDRGGHGMSVDYAVQYLKELGFDEELKPCKPTTEKCIKTALKVLKRYGATYDLDVDKLNGKQLILKAMKCDQNDLWILLLMTLPLFQKEDTFNTETILSTLKEHVDENEQEILHNIIFWMKEYWIEDFYENKELQQQIERDWLKYDCINIQYQKWKKLRQQLPNKENIDDKNNEEYQGYGPLLGGLIVNDGSNLSTKRVSEYSAKDIAEQITLINYALFCEIKPRELINQKWKRDSESNIVFFINNFNNLTVWAQISILRERNVKQRAKTIAKIIEIADYLKNMKNYSSFCAIWDSLNSAAIHRLKIAWKKVADKIISQYQELGTFREMIRKHQGVKHLLIMDDPCIPYIGTCLTDLVFIDEAHKDSYKKYLQTANKIKCLQSFQNIPYFYLNLDEQIQEDLMRELDKMKDMTEDDIWDMSTEIKKQDERSK